MPATATRNQGKSAFVREVLNDNPQANAASVNEAWRAAGRPGDINAGLVNHLRFRMGLSGNLRAKKTAGTKRGPWAQQVRAGTNRTTPATSRGRPIELMNPELSIDRLLMKVAEIGPLSDVEHALREARRQLYAAMVAEA
jgi:hypothetical protein